VQIELHDPDSGGSLLHALESQGLVYGDGLSYASLVSPASVVVSSAEVRELGIDLCAVAELYRTVNELYLSSLDGDAPDWIRACVEQGLTPVQREAHELTARARLEPVMGRADYVEVRSGRRQLAEMQWKSGGPGLLIGHQRAYAEAFAHRAGTSPLGDLETTYLDTLFATSPAVPAVVANEVRSEWLNGEAGLVKRADERGWSYRSMNRATLASSLTWGPHGLRLREDEGSHDVTVLRGRGFTEVLADELTLRLATAALNETIWIEAPLNFLYRQKWCLALPFARDLANHFADRTREIVIPSALVLGECVDLTCIADQISSAYIDQVASVRTLADLVQLPGGLRRRLVFKCGAGVGDYHSRGRGVFRLAGSRRSAATVVDFVRQRVAEGEPWILQPFVDDKYTVPLAIPTATKEIEMVVSHSRLMVFGGRQNDQTWQVQGAIGNFAKHWKVSGSPAGTDTQGETRGSAFVDVRLKLPASATSDGLPERQG